MASMPWRTVSVPAFALLFWVGCRIGRADISGADRPRRRRRRICSSASDRAELTADLKALEDKSSDQVVVVTVPSLQGYTIEDYGYQLGRHGASAPRR